jgi:hypothetical protein
MVEPTQTVIIRRESGNPGLLAGILGCVLGCLGIFSLGIVFVPLAALCSVIGLVRGLSGTNAPGIGMSLLGCALTVAGFMTSPSLWLLSGMALVSSMYPSHPVQQAPSPPPMQQRIYQPEYATAAPGSVEAMNIAKAKAYAAMQECRGMRLAGQLKTHAASCDCSNPRILSAYQSAGYRYMDLVVMMTKARHDECERIDRGLLTEAQSQVEYAQLMNTIHNIEQQRDRGMK